MEPQQHQGDINEENEKCSLHRAPSEYKEIDANNSINRIPPPFYVSHGTCFYDRISEIQSENDPMLRFRLYAQSEEFQKFVNTSGIQRGTFVCNPNANPSNASYKKFLIALNDPFLSQKFVALVFHGTPAKNIPNILQNGLDPKERKNQAYGPGEYFSKDPSTSASYCKGDKGMLVFVVIMPSLQKNLPYGYVVVKKSQHQLPLGTLYFETIDEECLERSLSIKRSLQDLHEKAYQKEKLVIQSKVKFQIIQYLVQNKVDLAMEKYEKNAKDLPLNFNREISMYVHYCLNKDKSIIDHLFPNLPPPFEQDDFDTQIKSIEAQEEEAKRSRDELDKRRKHLLENQSLQYQQPQQAVPSFNLHQGLNGGWQSDKDIIDRRKIIARIVQLLQQRKPNAPQEWLKRLPLMAKRLEESLYRSAKSFQEYNDTTTLKQRLQKLAVNIEKKTKMILKQQQAQQQPGIPPTSILQGVSNKRPRLNLNAPALVPVPNSVPGPDASEFLVQAQVSESTNTVQQHQNQHP